MSDAVFYTAGDHRWRITPRAVQGEKRVRGRWQAAGARLRLGRILRTPPPQPSPSRKLIA